MNESCKKNKTTRVIDKIIGERESAREKEGLSIDGPGHGWREAETFLAKKKTCESKERFK